MQGAYALVRGGSSTSNLIESSRNIIVSEGVSELSEGGREGVP